MLSKLVSLKVLVLFFVNSQKKLLIYNLLKITGELTLRVSKYFKMWEQ